MATYVSKFTGAQIDQRLEMAEQVPNKADKSELPSKVSDLVNDSGFISETQKITGGGASKTVPEILVQTVENTTAISTEKNRAEEAEGALGAAINNERTRAQGAEQDNANAIAAEKSRAEGAEAAMNEKISALEASKYKVVEVLPETGETNVIYLVPSPRPSQKNIKDEFIWVDGAWEQIGSTEIDLSDYAHKGEVRHIERDLGMYPELEPVPLNSEVTGKYINSEGKYVDASGWNVASIGAVSLGNTYLLNMVSSANMVLGVALFVSRVYKRDKEGKIIGTTLTPLFSAKNTSIPASGYVLFEAMDDYEEVLICYKPELTTQMLVARWGFKASHATQLRNLRLVVDNKTDFEGIYELLTAGYALNLVGKGNGEPQAFMSRKTGGGNITDGSAVIKEVDGVKPIVWNQLITNGDFSSSLDNWYYYGGSIALVDGMLEFTADSSDDNGKGPYVANTIRTIIGHKYLIAYDAKATTQMQIILCHGMSSGNSLWLKSDTITANKSRQGFLWTNLDITDLILGFRWLTNNVSQKLYIDNVILIDLTQMFGAGNEPSTYEEYLDRISHYHIADEYAHNAGEVVNYRGTGIKTTNVDGTKTYVRDWSEVMKKYFPDGMTNLNGVKDFFDDKKAVRKWGVKVFDGMESWTTKGVGFLCYVPKGIPGYVTGRTMLSNMYAFNEGGQGGYDINHDKVFYIRGLPDECSVVFNDSAYASVNEWKSHLADLYAQGNPLVVYYELAEPVEDIFEKPLNLTYTVINGGTETSLATENSTQFEGSIFYGKDYVGVIDELQLQNRVTQIEFENWEN